MSNFNEESTAVMAAGSIEYSAETAAVPIEEMIEMLEDMKNEGVEFLLMGSGNYRGAQWQSLGTRWDFLPQD